MAATPDRVKVIWEGTGTGTPISLGGAVDPTYFAPSADLDGELVSYLIRHMGESIFEMELGRGIYTHSGATLARTQIAASTNGGENGSAVNFSAGVKHVSLVVLSDDIKALAYFDEVTEALIAAAAVTAGKIAEGAVSYDKIAGVSKRAVTATPTLGVYELSDSNSGRAFRAEEAVEFEIQNNVSKGAWWELIGRSSGVTVAIEGDAGNIVHNGANVDEVTLLNGYDATLTVEVNAGTAPNVAASGGFSGAVATPAGPVDFADNVVSRPELKDYAETSTSPTNSAGTVVLDYALGNIFQHTLTANITTLTLSNWPATGRAGSMVLFITQGAGPFTIAWPAAVDWPGGVAPTLSTGSGDVDIFSFLTLDGGTRVLGIPGGQDFS